MPCKINITANALHSSHGCVLKTSAGFPVDLKGLIRVWFGNKNDTELLLSPSKHSQSPADKKKSVTLMQAATLSSSPGSEKGHFRGKGSSWCPSVGLVEPSGGMGFCSRFLAPWWLHLSRSVSLLYLVLQNWPFSAENQLTPYGERSGLIR